MCNTLELSVLFICLGGLTKVFSAWGGQKKLLGYGLGGSLTRLTYVYIPNEHCAKGSFNFCEEIQKVRSNDYFLVSYVCSLFTSISLTETLKIAIDLIFQNKPNLKISKNELKQFFKFATSGTHFLFKDGFYDQIAGGVSMGSPLGPVLPNLLMGHHERNWLQEIDICTYI